MRQSEVAYLRLRDDILNGVMRPGDPLSEATTANRLGISRTPVREAIRQLVQENLVTVIAGRGAFVASVSLTDIVELFQLRQALEPFAAQLAAARPANPALQELLARFEAAPELINAGDVEGYSSLCAEMDGEISRMTENGRLQNALRSIWQEARRLRKMSQANTARLIESAQEHQEILRAIMANDAEKAGALTKQHLSNSFENILDSLRVSHGDLPSLDNGGLSRR